MGPQIDKEEPGNAKHSSATGQPQPQSTPHTMKEKIRRTSRYYYLKVIRLQGDPQTIARGMAVGVFIGITPTIPLHTIAILFFSYLLRGNTIAAFLANLFVCNPLTYFPQYYLSWLIGNWLTGGSLSWERIHAAMEVLFSGAGYAEILQTISHLGKEAVIVMLLGGFILATPFTVVSYVGSLRFFTTLRNKRRARHILN